MDLDITKTPPSQAEIDDARSEAKKKLKKFQIKVYVVRGCALTALIAVAVFAAVGAVPAVIVADVSAAVVVVFVFGVGVYSVVGAVVVGAVLVVGAIAGLSAVAGLSVVVVGVGAVLGVLTVVAVDNSDPYEEIVASYLIFDNIQELKAYKSQSASVAKYLSALGAMRRQATVLEAKAMRDFIDAQTETNQNLELSALKSKIYS